MLLGFDIGGTKSAVITAQWADGEIRVLNKKKVPADLAIAPEAMIARLIELADTILEEKPEAIGVPEAETFKVQELHLPVYHCL